VDVEAEFGAVAADHRHRVAIGDMGSMIPISCL
jgi:hypothetical protein